MARVQQLRDGQPNDATARSRAAKTDVRKKLWLIRVRTRVSRVLPSGNSSDSSAVSEPRPVMVCNHRSLSNASQLLLNSFQMSTSDYAPCVAPAMLRFFRAGSSRAKFASFHDTADGVRPIDVASSMISGLRICIRPKGILQ